VAAGSAANPTVDLRYGKQVVLLVDCKTFDQARKSTCVIGEVGILRDVRPGKILVQIRQIVDRCQNGEA